VDRNQAAADRNQAAVDRSRAADRSPGAAVEARHIPVGGRTPVAAPEVVHSRAAVLVAVRSRVAAVLEVVRIRVAVAVAAGIRRGWGWRPKDRSDRRGALGAGS
jgi:hypothetical protein